MSDAKVRRSGRDAGRSEVAADMPPIDHAAPIIPDVGVPDVGVGTEPAIAGAEPTGVMLPAAVPPMVEPSRITADDGWARLGEVQLAFARSFEAATVQMTGMARSGFASGADAAVALIGARTIAEVVEINAALMRRGVDAALESSAKLTEIGMEAMAETSRLLLRGAAAP